MAAVSGDKDQYIRFARNLAAGGVAASIAKTVNSPFEVAKLILQTQPGRFAGLKDLFVRLPAEEGFAAFWRGNAVNVMRYFPTQALNFAFNDTYNELIMPLGRQSYSSADAFGRGLLAGGLAGATAIPFVFPLDLLRTKLSTDQKDAQGNRRYKGLVHAAQETVRAGGIRGLYKGAHVSMIGVSIYRGLYFSSYGTLKSIFLSDPERAKSFWLKWLVAETTSITAQFIVYPYDTIKRNLMKAGEVQADGTVRRVYKGAIDCIKHLYAENGMKGFYRGALTNTYRATGAALCMALYDTFQDYIKK